MINPDRLACWLTGLAARLTSPLTVGWLTGRLAYSFYKLCGWLTGWPTGWTSTLFQKYARWLAGWLSDWLTAWLTGWLADCLAG